MNNQLLLEELDGVIKYQLDYILTPSINHALLSELNAWRSLLYRLGLIGLDSERYGGLAYGNISLRQNQSAFLISGTQTGSFPALGAEHYCLVKDYDLAKNLLIAEGPIKPSSEALTHAAVYQADPQVNCVLHVHSPELWNRAEHLAIPMTRTSVSYGTPAMAEQVQQLLHVSRSPLIAMGGHRDGLVAV